MSLNDEEIENLSNKCVRKTYEKDDYIIKQDDPGDSLFVIADGICGVYVNTPDKKMISVAKLSTTDFFGEFSLMTGEKRSASVIAESPTVALVVEKERMKSVMKNNSEMYDYVSNVLAKRKLELNKTISKENNKNTNVKNIASELKSITLKIFTGRVKPLGVNSSKYSQLTSSLTKLYVTSDIKISFDGALLCNLDAKLIGLPKAVNSSF